VRDLSTKVDTVQKSTDDIKKKEETKAEEEANKPLDMGMMDMAYMFPSNEQLGSSCNYACCWLHAWNGRQYAWHEQHGRNEWRLWHELSATLVILTPSMSVSTI
jgi:hypothetical protein